MALPIQIHTLIVEDSEEDTELLLRELQKGGYDPIYERVETRESLQAALDDRRWDIIFSDYTMPQLKGTETLTLLRERGNDPPFFSSGDHRRGSGRGGDEGGCGWFNETAPAKGWNL